MELSEHQRLAAVSATISVVAAALLRRDRDAANLDFRRNTALRAERAFDGVSVREVKGDLDETLMQATWLLKLGLSPEHAEQARRNPRGAYEKHAADTLQLYQAMLGFVLEVVPRT